MAQPFGERLSLQRGMKSLNINDPRVIGKPTTGSSSLKAKEKAMKRPDSLAADNLPVRFVRKGETLLRQGSLATMALILGLSRAI